MNIGLTVPRHESRGWTSFPIFRHHRTIQLINPLWNAAGGSEWRTLGLYHELKDRGEVKLWSSYRPDPVLAARYPIRRIAPRRLEFPRTGTFVFVGAYVEPGRWVHLTLPRRIILVYNTPDPEPLARLVDVLSRRGSRTVELVYASESLKRSIGLPGVVHLSPIDLDRFVPAERRDARDDRHRFTVGRLSRDVPGKHHPDDPQFYQRLVDAGCRVRIMGGVSLAGHGCTADNVELLPECAEEPQVFLQGLDCFFYRTANHLTEAFGRVVLEAMACGIPVVCQNRGGYVEVIDSGRNGFLFETEREALEILLRLKDDEPLRAAIGRAARETARNLYSPDHRREMADFYLC
jgi:glycosyltransferase involved in cell wall biosynthesis